ncbi:MAG: 4Fe-4S binding protein [Candidatus Sumerlaeia bacterium]
MKIKKRRLVQFGALALFHIPFLAALTPAARCIPVFSCHACVATWNICPVGALMHYAGWHLIPFYLIGLILLFGALIGRLFCGWICPFGTLQMLLYKIPSPKFRLPAWTGYIKYVLLAALVVIIPYYLGELTYYSFCRVCPVSTIQVTIPYFLTNENAAWSGWLTTSRFIVFGSVIILAIASSRSFCKVACPVGAMMGPFNHISLWKVKAPEQCPSCKKCDRVCSTDVKPSERMGAGTSPNRHHDCIVCHECQTACPVNIKQKKDKQKQ